MTPENCPKCEKKLPSPLQSSGRQVCSSCGWSSRKLSSEQSSELIEKPVESKKLKQLLNWLTKFIPNRKNALVAIVLSLLALNQLLKQRYDYTITSPSDYLFEESMNELGAQGWQAVNCRRAVDSSDKYSYECIMMRQKRSLF